MSLLTVLGIVVAIALAPRRAFAYVDPGLVYALLQGTFALLVGVATAWVLGPWSYLKKWFRRSSDKREKQGRVDGTSSDQPSKQPPEET